MTYRIKPKRDFGDKPFLVNGQWVSTGFVVTLNGCNVMPGATWFRTIPDALKAITIYEHVQHDSDRFWKLLYRINGVTQRSRRLHKESLDAIRIAVLETQRKCGWCERVFDTSNALADHIVATHKTREVIL